MSDLVWGELAKSQIDPEKIEGAISRMIQEHNNDEEAHVGPGQSLQSHKASEVIDHRVGSIVSDIIKDKEVIIPKIGWDRYLFQSSFESLAGFTLIQDGSGGSAVLGGGGCRIAVGNSIGNQTKLLLVGLNMVIDMVKDPAFQCRLSYIDEANDDDVGVAVGPSDIFIAKPEGFGFVWKGNEKKMYCFCGDGNNLYKNEIIGYNEEEEHILSAEVVGGGAEVLFYVDGDQVGSYEWGSVATTFDYFFNFSIKRIQPYAEPSIVMRNLILYQNW